MFIRRQSLSLLGVILVILILMGCRNGVSQLTDTTTAAPLSNSTVLPLRTYTPTPNHKTTPTILHLSSVTPSATKAIKLISPWKVAPFIHFASWSPDSQWIAFWVSSTDDIASSPSDKMPGGTLYFANIRTRQSCAETQFTTPSYETVKVHWSNDGRAIVIMPDVVYIGNPCQTGSYSQETNPGGIETQSPGQSLSPNGLYDVDTTLQLSENGFFTFKTTITTADHVRVLQSVTWKIEQREGRYEHFLGGEWISSKQFLLNETQTEGPLIIDVDKGVISVVTKLFNLGKIPQMSVEGYGLVAIAAPKMDQNDYHLLLKGIGTEASFPKVMLYHSENRVVETLPFSHVWSVPFSPDGQWLLMDSRSDLDDSHIIWIRPIENIGGEWQQITSGLYSAMWNDNWTEMVFIKDENIIWQTFPEARLIGGWDTNPYWTYSLEWSPNGQFLVVEGNVPGVADYGLFVLER